MAELREALRLVEENIEECDFVGPRDEALVAAAEAALGFRFPPTYREFVLRLGAGDVGAEEIYGVIDDNFEDSGVPNGVWATLRSRQAGFLPDSMMRVYYDGFEHDYVLDIAATDETGEAPVRLWASGASHADDPPVVVAPDFGTFFLELTTKALDQ